MEKEIEPLKETPTISKWYFGLHPRLFLTVPTFLLFAYQGLWFIRVELQDISLFFRSKPITWGSIFLILFFGSILIWFFLAPIYISFMSIEWMYEVHTGNYKPWRKFFYTIGLFLLVLFGTTFISMFTAWVLGLV